jgi:hypothetical protein
MLRSATIILLVAIATASLFLVPMCAFSARSSPQPANAEEATVMGEELAQEDWERLQAAGWPDYVRDCLGLWVSVPRQRLVGIQDGRVLFEYRCSTAAAGAGNRLGSRQTPLGWHLIDERFGDGLPVGAVFKERRYTGRVYDPANPTHDDLVLTRIMWLRGLEPGVNLGSGIDSHDRFIYIHGTPEEDKLGTPASMGCVRLSNQHVADLYDQAPTGTLVLITDW